MMFLTLIVYILPAAFASKYASSNATTAANLVFAEYLLIETEFGKVKDRYMYTRTNSHNITHTIQNTR